MIVEDHSAFAQVLELILGQVEGAEVALARTLEEGRTLIRGDEPFDVVVLDLTLPDGEGTDLVAELRQHRPEIPVAVLSARNDVEERSEEHTSELQSRQYLVCRLLLEKKKPTQRC